MSATKKKKEKREARFANTQFIDSFISAQSNSVTVCQPQSKLARNPFMRYGREYTLSTKRGEQNVRYKYMALYEKTLSCLDLTWPLRAPATTDQ